MLTHAENNKRIIAYLSYLRDISRKIISRNGFEKCLLTKQRPSPFELDDEIIEKWDLKIKKHLSKSTYQQINLLYDNLQKNINKKMFIGFGMIIGKTLTKKISGPVLFLRCEMLKDNEKNIIIEPDLNSLCLNYDLISSVAINHINYEDDSDYNQDSKIDDLEIYGTLETIENQLQKFVDFTFDEINVRFNKFDEFNDEEFFDSDLKDNGKETNSKNSNEFMLSGSWNLELLKLKRIVKEIVLELKEINSFKNIKLLDEEVDEDIKNIEELSFLDRNYLFINQIPDQLSTYEALNSFVKKIEAEEDFKNPIVEKLLINGLTTDETVPFEIDNSESFNEDNLNNIARNQLPLSLSNNQIQGILNAWRNEISYIQGPPGTGKSHTISAIILSAVLLNKKVLVLSQKTAALEIILKNIQPFFQEADNDLLKGGICYFDSSNKKSIRENSKNISNLLQNQPNIKNTANYIFEKYSQLEKVFGEKHKQLINEKKILEVLIEKQRVHYEINENFNKEIKRFQDDFDIKKSDIRFNFVKNRVAYDICTNYLNSINDKTLYNNKISLIDNLFLTKLKRHLFENFDVKKYQLDNSNFIHFAIRLIELNKIYTEVVESRPPENHDSNYIRKNIKNLTDEVHKIQKELLITAYQMNIYRSLYNNSEIFKIELDKFQKILYYNNTSKIDLLMQKTDYKKIVRIFPFWAVNIRDIGHLFPLDTDLFDLIIVDESSQVNLAEILPAFYRGKKICIVGDHKQLSLKSTGLTFSLNKSYDQNIWNKYNTKYLNFEEAVKKCLIVSKSSILDYIKNEEEPLNSLPKEVMLEEHYRSLPELAKFTSENFYTDVNNPNGGLIIMKDTPENQTIKCFQAINVNGYRSTENGEKVILEEVNEIIDIIQCLILYKNNSGKYLIPSHINKEDFTIGVISMIRDQCDKIEEMINSEIPDLDDKYKLMIGTPEEFQGNERDVMIFSLCLDMNCNRGQGHFQDAKRLNVATSRAKYFTYFVYSPFNQSFHTIHKYLNYINGGSVENSVRNELDQKTMNILPPFAFEKMESDFECYVKEVLDKFIEFHSEGYTITLHNQIITCGKKRLDFVLYNNDTKKSVAIEVDGKYHYYDNGINHSFDHKVRIEELMIRGGWNIINTPYYKWWRDGWLSDDKDYILMKEVERIYTKIREYIF